MHVVVLAEFAVPSGGAEKVALESARGLAETGLTVTYVQAIEGPADPLLDHPRITRIGLGLADVWTRSALSAALSAIWHREAARRLVRALDGLAWPPDVLHLHQWTRSLSPSVFPVLFARSVPVVTTLHDYFLACPNGVHYRFDRTEPCALTPISVACLAAPCDGKSRAHKLVRVARTAALRAAIGRRRLDVVHVCDASRMRIGGLLGRFDLAHHRIDNPVRVPFAPPADPASGNALAYVGRLTREKGADLVAEAAALAGLTALFIGTGPLEAELRGRPNVELVGWQAPEAVERLLRSRARVVVAPSRWYETGPLTVYEALAAGLPVIASNRAGAAEKVADGVNGFVVEPEAGVLAVALRRLASDDQARALGRAAHARYWAAPMTLAAHAEALVKLYHGLLRERAHPAAAVLSLDQPLDAVS
ncbi:glycosyltransferase [Methylobacterium iners]|uniref:D-inositol-3-phosphate glycosyltransferase n=1 Tax=Methylobacterium iners TaxID=418707 RepID=A0ABQ4S4H0_9HYPH|nr:glycosyltransferase [Methylobacterium iners]GJD96794.1 D-inositol-3-phosphate glycosyltransferase [Methylobacterium iners]